MKRILQIIILFSPFANCFSQLNLNESIARLDSNNTFLLKALLADICKPTEIWESLSLKFNFDLYKKTLTDVSDSLFEYSEQYPFQIVSLTKNYLNQVPISKQKIKFDNLYFKVSSRSDYENLKDRLITDFEIFQNNFDLWKLDPLGHRQEITDYNDRLNKYLSEFVFEKQNSVFVHYTILYAIISHVIQQLSPTPICKNQIEFLFKKFKAYYSKNNTFSITNLYDNLTDLTSYFKNKYPTAWQNIEITVVPRVEFWFGGRICWVIRFYALYSGSIYKGFNYDKIHYWGLEWSLFSCVAVDGHTYKVGEEWDPRCIERPYPDNAALGPPSAIAIKKSLNDESFQFNQALNRSTNLKILIDNLTVSYN